MIISKTPVRISFFGGGTDYPDHYKQHGGAVLSTTIDKYIFITVKSLEGLLEYKYRIAYSTLELCNNVEEIQHPVVKACIKFLDIKEGLEVNIISDLPARTGIGSSSSFTVGLLNALYALKGKMVSKEQLANEAIHIEQVILNERVGVQDQCAAAYGSLNQMTFEASGRISVNPVIVSDQRKGELQKKLIMFYTGVSRYAHQVLEEQIQKTKENKITPDLNRIKQMVDEGLDIVCNGKDLKKFGELMHEGWMTKKGLSSAVSNTFLDDIYERARKAGAIGGKLLGAGGGGFFVFYVEEAQRADVRNALAELPEISFKFENDGTRIIFFS
jgi:D-glycero-alpha-D-manno-heptose-7-phosphate kinase